MNHLGAAFALGATLGPALSGVLAAQVGPIPPLFLVAVLAATASFAVMRFLPESKSPELPLESAGQDYSCDVAPMSLILVQIREF
jgi:MFS family permease